MSQAQPQSASPPPVWPMYRAMVGIGILCGILIVAVFQTTRPVIERKQAEALQRAILEVLPEARSSRNFALTPAGDFEPQADEIGDAPLVHAGYDDSRRLVGLAVEATSMGYQDAIRLLYGYSFDRDAIIGIRVLESRETPGLGDRIETDPDFLKNFEHLDVSLSEDGSHVAHPLVAVKHGEKQHPWQIDGITGATISSAAVAKALRESTERWVPTIRRNLDEFREAR